MSDSPTFISFDGLTANVQVARALIDEYNVELSTVQAHLDRIMEEQEERQVALLLSKTAAREELLPQIEKQERIEVEQLEAEFDARRVPFEDQMRSLLAKIDGVKATIAPIRKLPAEILGNIFREVVWGGVSPWLLTTVSKSWRITCLTTPSLWSNIDVGTYEYRHVSSSRWIVDGQPRYTCGNRTICRTLDEFAYIAEKSGAVPLDVVIDSRPTEDLDEVLKGLLGEPYSSRISSIYIAFLNTKSKEEMAGWTLGRFPILRNLTCGSLQEPVIELILSQASQLHTLTVRHDLSSALIRHPHPIWKSLRNLYLGYLTRADDFNGIVSGLSLVEEISVPDSWPNESTPNVTLEYIKTIALSCPPKFLARLRLPRLQRLYWTGNSANSSHPGHLNVEPNWKFSFPSVTYLTYSKAQSSGNEFESVLKYLPNVHTVYIEPSKKPGPNVCVLELLKSLASVEDMLCPRMRRLTLGDCVYQVSTSKNSANPIIKRLIKARVELGIPLEHFEICWTRRSSENGETIQYIR